MYYEGKTQSRDSMNFFHESDAQSVDVIQYRLTALGGLCRQVWPGNRPGWTARYSDCLLQM